MALFSNEFPEAGGELDKDLLLTRRHITHRLLKVVDPANIRLIGRRWEIALSRDWPHLLSSLRGVGECLLVSCNVGAALGSVDTFPRLCYAADLLTAQSADGALDFEFRPWASAAVVAEENGGVFSFFVEVRDWSGSVIQKIGLTAGSCLESFLDWVEECQACRAERGAVSPADAWGRRWCTVQQRHWFDYEDTEEMEARLVAALFDEALRDRRPLRAVVGNEGVVQAVEICPEDVRSSPGRVLVSAAEVGLQFKPERFSSVIIHRQTPALCRHEALSLKCFAEDGLLCLALVPPDSQSWEEWNAFLRAFSAPYFLG